MKHRCCVDSVGNVVGRLGNCMSDRVGKRGDGVSCNRDNSSMAKRDNVVGADRWLDLNQTLRVVRLADRGVGGAKDLGLHQASLLTIGRCHCLVGRLATNCMVNKAVVREAMVTDKEGRLSCSSRERSKADGKSLNSIVTNPKCSKKNFEPLQPSSCSSECVPGRTDES